MVKIPDKNLPELAKVYNDGGKSALYHELRNSYGIKYPVSVFERMRKIASLGYNESKDLFDIKAKKNPDEDLFISIDELCSPMKPQHVIAKDDAENIPKTVAMERLVKELLGDRLLELSRYVILDTMSKTMIIDKTALSDAGYALVTH